jgi:hypothetical protein
MAVDVTKVMEHDVDLNDQAAGSNDGLIAVPFAGRIQVTAALVFGGPVVGGTSGVVGCMPKVAPQGAPYGEMEAQIAEESIPSHAIGALTATGTQEVPPPPTSVDCGTTGGNTVRFRRGTLVVTAVAR